MYFEIRKKPNIFYVFYREGNACSNAHVSALLQWYLMKTDAFLPPFDGSAVNMTKNFTQLVVFPLEHLLVNEVFPQWGHLVALGSTALALVVLMFIIMKLSRYWEVWNPLQYGVTPVALRLKAKVNDMYEPLKSFHRKPTRKCCTILVAVAASLHVKSKVAQLGRFLSFVFVERVAQHLFKVCLRMPSPPPPGTLLPKGTNQDAFRLGSGAELQRAPWGIVHLNGV